MPTPEDGADRPAPHPIRWLSEDPGSSCGRTSPRRSSSSSSGWPTGPGSRSPGTPTSASTATATSGWRWRPSHSRRLKLGAGVSDPYTRHPELLAAAPTLEGRLDLSRVRPPSWDAPSPFWQSPGSGRRTRASLTAAPAIRNERSMSTLDQPHVPRWPLPFRCHLVATSGVFLGFSGAFRGEATGHRSGPDVSEIPRRMVVGGAGLDPAASAL